jgi:hypothetical protein
MTPWVSNVSAIAIILFCGVSTPAGMPENGLPQTLWSNVPDYTTMWWMHGLRDERKVFAIQTSRLALAFDVPAFQLTHLMTLRKGSPTRNDALGGPNPPSEVEALTLKNEALVGPSNASLVCSLRADESTYQATGASQDFTDSRLIESGKCFQRRTVNEIVWTRGAPIRESSLEIAAWPDRLTLWLRVTPQRAIAQGELAMVLAAADEFTVAAAPGDVKRDRVEGRSRWIARLVLENWSAGEERTLALILSLDASSEDETPTIRAEQMAPTRAPLDVTYDNVLGWFRVDLRNDVSGASTLNPATTGSSGWRRPFPIPRRPPARSACALRRDCRATTVCLASPVSRPCSAARTRP